MTKPRVGVIGDGQLARMLQRAAIGLGVELVLLTTDPDSSAGQVIPRQVAGARDDEAAIRELARRSDVITFEFELLPPEIPARLAAEGVVVRPGPGALLCAQDKLHMRRELTRLGVPCPRWGVADGDGADGDGAAGDNVAGDNVAGYGADGGDAADGGGLAVGGGADADGGSARDRVTVTGGAAAGGLSGGGAAIADSEAFERFAKGRQVVAKPARGGYDGHGVRFVSRFEEIVDWLAVGPVLLEEKVAFRRELALMFARRPSGEIRLWPVVESTQADGICVEVVAPAPRLAPEVAEQLTDIARRVGDGLDVTGVCAIEAFELAEPRADGTRVVVNELALRPHNSGHWSLGGAATDQFEQHLRAVLDWPLGPTEPLAPAVAMVNVLGSSLGELTDALPDMFAVDPGLRVELYGKAIRPGRKLGHVTALDQSPAHALGRARVAAALLRGETQLGPNGAAGLTGTADAAAAAGVSGASGAATTQPAQTPQEKAPRREKA